MRKLITTIALLALVDTSVAIAQTVSPKNPSAPPPSANPDMQLLPEAPVGHRQPRTDQVPSEQSLTGDPNDPINRRTRRLTAWSKAFAAVAKYSPFAPGALAGLGDRSNSRVLPSEGIAPIWHGPETPAGGASEVAENSRIKMGVVACKITLGISTAWPRNR
jgi:hypothetical protein